ncbi:MAG: efflux RND transporter periplasmic adaptor subunit [Chlamydiae bacterium]|nr:efflux RND transporter periplasmic adaptor subunit [Chlamydiota bacterium]MBI3276927.1 efflux RND transporter periplasmic adaptor subunit [Chlamydiota bacterium]
MAKKNRLTRTLIILVIGVGIIFAQIKYKAFTKIKDSLFAKKKEEAKPEEKGEKPEEKKEGPKKEGEAKPQEQQEPVSVKVTKAQKTDFQDILPVLGTIEGIAEIDLKFEVPGVIEFYNFKDGDRVRRGDVIARLDNQDSLLKVKYRKAKLEVAETALEGAHKKIEMYQHLYDIGAIIKAKLEEAQIEVENKTKEVEAAKIEVESAKQELSKTYLKSPIDGVLGAREAEPGEYVTSNNDIVSVIDTTEVYAKIGIVEKDINKIQAQQMAKFTIDSAPNRSFDGEVVTITPMIKGKSRTLTVKAKIANDDNLLIPGMFTRGLVVVFSKKNTFSIPIKAIETSGEQSFVYVADEKNIAHQKPVKIGYTAMDDVQIDEGIEEGDLVITDTPVKLKDGAPIKITEKEEASGEAPKGVGAEVGEKE